MKIRGANNQRPVYCSETCLLHYAFGRYGRKPCYPGYINPANEKYPTEKCSRVRFVKSAAFNPDFGFSATKTKKGSGQNFRLTIPHLFVIKLCLNFKKLSTKIMQIGAGLKFL